MQIPYDDILFIEKNVEDAYSTVVTKNDRIVIKNAIKNIEEQLKESGNFFRTHRSCIVNIDNIISVELKACIIHFHGDETAQLSRDRKKELKERLGKFPKTSKKEVTL